MMRARFIFALLAVLVATPACADWPAEKAQLVAAAEREGELVVYCQPNQAVRAFITKEWENAYPKIKLSLVVIPAPQFQARIRTERGADKFLWDLGFSGSVTGFELAKAGFADPVLPELRDPDVARPEVWGGWDEAFVDLAKQYVLSVQIALKTPVYNALKLSPDKVKAEGLKMLFDPELKDRVVWHDPAIPGGGQQYAIYLRNRLGDAELRRFILDQRVKFVAQQNQVIEALAHGSAWLGLGPGNARVLMEPYVKAGIQADIRGFGNAPELNDVTIGGSTFYVVKNRPHPNATRLFLNWFLTREVQDGFAKATDQNSRRTDVASVADADATPIPGAKYLSPQREEHVEALMDAVRFVGEVRKEAR
jgi:iron(III) transport system substrate-binding protein